MQEESRIADPEEHGTMTKERQRSDLAEIAEKVAKGVPIAKIAEESPATYVRNYRGLAALADIATKPRDWVTEVHIRWGEANVGKTRYVHDCYDDVYVKSDPLWWSGYHGQETVLIDDVVWPDASSKNWKLDEMPRRQVLEVFDRYPCQVAIKGGNVKFVAKRIFLTSNFDPTEFLESDPAIKRRITSVLHVVPQSGSTDGQVILSAHPLFHSRVAEIVMYSALRLSAPRYVTHFLIVI